MKSFSAILASLTLVVTPNIALLTNTTSNNANFQRDENYTYFWNKRNENEVTFHSWYVYDTEPSYQNIFLTEINLSAETDDQLQNIDQVNDIHSRTNPVGIPPLGYPAAFWVRTYAGGVQEFLDDDSNSFMNQLNNSSLEKKLSGNIGDKSEKALYDGAQYTIGTWDIVNADNVAMKVALKTGLTIYKNQREQPTLAIWGSIFIQSAPAEYWLGGLGFIPLGESLKVNYELY